MRIDKIYIAAFGGLKDYTLLLHDGLNVVFGENENGKSTVAAFLKMMFYGSGKARQELAKSPRQKYTPWSGEPMAGRVYFEHNGKRYCLEREFKKSDATDKITLRNLDLGTSETASTQVGLQFFGLSAAAFERSVFIGQAGRFDRDEAAEGELNGRLANLSTTGNENVSYNAVAERLQKALSALCTPRKVGAYDKNAAAYQALEERLWQADHAAAQRKSMTEQLSLLKEKIVKTKKICDGLKSQIDRRQEIQSAEKMREYLAVKQELDTVNADLHLTDGTLLDNRFITEIQLHQGNYTKKLQRVTDKKADMAPLAQSIALCENDDGLSLKEQAAALERESAALQQQLRSAEDAQAALAAKIEQARQQSEAASTTKKKAWGIPASLLMLTILFGAAGAALHTVWLFVAAAVSAIGAVLSVFLRPVDKKAAEKAEAALAALIRDEEQQRQRLTEITAARDDVENRQQQVQIALGTNAAVLREKKEALAQMQMQLSESEDELREAAAGLTALLQRIEPHAQVEDTDALLADLNRRTETQKTLKTRLKYLANDLGGISYEEAAEKLAALPETDDSAVNFDALKAEWSAKMQEGQQLYDTYNIMQNDLKHAVAGAENPEQLRREIAAMQQTMKAQKQYADAAQTALQFLADSFAEVRRGYGSVLEQRTKEIFSDITAGRYTDVGVSKELTLSAEQGDTFGNHSADYFSTGTGDQLYFSLRLALSELLSENEALPLVLDDVFGQYDDRRAERAMRFLRDYAARSQVILFTCHQNICQTAKELSCNITPLLQDA